MKKKKIPKRRFVIDCVIDESNHETETKISYFGASRGDIIMEIEKIKHDLLHDRCKPKKTQRWKDYEDYHTHPKGER